jgi:flagellar biosynthesis protein FlhB
MEEKEMLFELIMMNVLGVIFIYIGFMILKKEKISLIHSYHYQKVKECDKKAYSQMIGIGVLLMGIGMILTGIIDYITKTAYGWFFFGGFFIIGIVIMFKAQNKYNGGVF